ncbi:MAG TPA: NPCBM/NEW2 domain-containing protein [Candidatus Hydrogenedentes bacterium]|nr:NPCBM/NEW2 domain-containing protein [Candidatus Hydrogenedentota bacterium]HPG67115.1 NPCBM/NEW2 domain-containing protein [Candidatus Hydrogenedentota bacterium]
MHVRVLGRTVKWLCAVTLVLAAKSSGAESRVWLEELDLGPMVQQYGRPQIGKSIEEKPLTLGGKVFEHGVGSHAGSEYFVDLDCAADRFEAVVGVDEEVGPRGSVAFEIWVDDVRVAETGIMRGGEPPKTISIDVSQGRYMALITLGGDDGISYDHADWADACFVLKPGVAGRPKALECQDEPAPPIAHGVAPEPAIHGPLVVGATPGRPFLHRIPATGERPRQYAAEGLPAGLAIDATTGIISGVLEAPGAAEAKVIVTNARGQASRRLMVVGGQHTLALTPPMGWNSWYACGVMVTEEMIREAADRLVETGLADLGYEHVCIDDCWADGRHKDGSIKLVEKKFKDMKALGDYLHEKGLKFGVYTSPGPKTCAGYEGSYCHELQDARTFASWGVDFLKHDWCSYTNVAPDKSLAYLKWPYLVMRQALDLVDRDIVYSLCQYGMGQVWTWGPEVHGNMWRTGGDIGFLDQETSWPGVAAIGFWHSDLAPYAGPGHWNDPDMLMITGEAEGAEAMTMNLTPNERIAHFTLWAMIAAPLILSCDLAVVDAFALDVLGNDEVIAVDQDPLGRAGMRCRRTAWSEVWSRPLYDGTLAVALFNRGPSRTDVSTTWAQLGLEGPQPVRDLWRKEDLGEMTDAVKTSVPPHGAALFKIGRPDAGAPIPAP